MMARVEGINPDEVEIGQKVKARISDLNGEPAIIFDVIKRVINMLENDINKLKEKLRLLV